MSKLAPWLTAVTAFTAYLLTLAPDLTWAHWGGDGGELITAAVTLGVPHPPGYPLYILLGKLVSFLPIGSMAYRFHLFSALCTALAAALLTATSARYSTRYNARPPFPPAIPAIATGLTFAFAGLIWSQAVIAEVYALNLALVAAFLWALTQPAQGKRPSYLTGLCLGFSLTTHLTSLLLLPLTLCQLPRQHKPALATGLLTGLLPLLALPWLARTGSPILWGQPDTWAGWWWLVSGQIYHANALALPADQLWPRLQSWTPLLLSQFTWLGLPLILLGSHRPAQSHTPSPVALSGTAVLFLLYAFTYATPDAAVLLLPALLLAGLLLAPALHAQGKIALLLPFALLLLNFQAQNLRPGPGSQTTAEAASADIASAATQALHTAPANAIVLTPGNETIFALWYVQHITTIRPDVILVDANLFAFDWYRRHLTRHYPHLHALALDDLDAFQQQNQPQHPIYPLNLKP